VLTGFNEAFIIDGATKDKLIKEDPKSAEIIKPILRGRDIKKYKAEFADQWLIATFPALHLNIDNYPAVRDYLKTFGKRLEQSGESGCRKKTCNNWFEVQDSIAYYAEFEKEKIVFQEMVQESSFVYDDKNNFCLDTGRIITGSSLKYLVALMNSSLFFYSIKSFYGGGSLGDKGVRMKHTFFENFPVPQISKEQQKPFETMVDFILFAKERGFDAEADIFEQVVDNMVYDLYFADSMKNADCYITDRIIEMIEPFDENESDDSKTEYIKLLAQAFKKDKTVQRCIIYSRIVKEVKTITGGNKDE
nr:hypothetical protein [bacterium]